MGCQLFQLVDDYTIKPTPKVLLIQIYNLKPILRKECINNNHQRFKLDLPKTRLGNPCR